MIGIVEFIGFYKLFKMKKIGYYIVTIILIIGLIISLVFGAILITLLKAFIGIFNIITILFISAILINVIFIVYLYKKRELFS